MRLPIHFTPLARRDVARAFAWYEAQRAGLGREWLDELDERLQRMSDHPEQFPVVRRRTRRALLTRFPYSIPFVEEKSKVVVLGVLHAKQDPRQFQSRIR